MNLTTILSKVVEHAIGDPIMDFLEKSGCWTDAQFAYRKNHSCQDALALVCCLWILALHRHKRIEIFCSDIKGAFDRVRSELLQNSGNCR